MSDRTVAISGRTSLLFSLFRREWQGYFSSPVASVFLIVFLVASGALTFHISGFFERNSADLLAFFNILPWLMLFLMPAIGMRLWAEEWRTGSVEFLLTLPVPVFLTVLAKFLAAWFFAGFALLLTTPLWVTVAWLGQPDHGVILAGYLGSWLMAGGFIAICSCVSAVTRNQVIAFVIGVAICFLFLMSGLPLVQKAFSSWAPIIVLDLLSALSFLTHYGSLVRGAVDLRILLYFGSLILLCLYLNTAILEYRRGR